MAFLKEKYINEIAPDMKQKFNLLSVMQIPKIEKVVINMGVGDAVQDSKNLELAVNELQTITGQKPVITRAKKSIATYKVRQGQGIGCKVTLRNDKMWAFIETLFNVSLPRVRDFRGISNKSFDGRGQIIFPQIVYDNVKKVRGFDITFVITGDSDEMSRYLLKSLGAPFQKLKEEK